MKFNIGDKVRVIKSGYGVAPEEVGAVVTITHRKQGAYDSLDGQGNGYKVSPAMGNTKSGFFGGYIGERSFELVSANSSTTGNYYTGKYIVKSFDLNKVPLGKAKLHDTQSEAETEAERLTRQHGKPFAVLKVVCNTKIDVGFDRQ